MNTIDGYKQVLDSISRKRIQRFRVRFHILIFVRIDFETFHQVDDPGGTRRPTEGIHFASSGLNLLPRRGN